MRLNSTAGNGLSSLTAQGRSEDPAASRTSSRNRDHAEGIRRRTDLGPYCNVVLIPERDRYSAACVGHKEGIGQMMALRQLLFEIHSGGMSPRAQAGLPGCGDPRCQFSCSSYHPSCFHPSRGDKPVTSPRAVHSRLTVGSQAIKRLGHVRHPARALPGIDTLRPPAPIRRCSR